MSNTLDTSVILWEKNHKHSDERGLPFYTFYNFYDLPRCQYLLNRIVRVRVEARCMYKCLSELLYVAPNLEEVRILDYTWATDCSLTDWTLFSNLKTLSIEASNGISSMASQIWEFERLQTLHIEMPNVIKTFPSLSGLSSLTHLSVIETGYVDSADLDFSFLTNLEYLHLECVCDVFPRGLGGMISLTTFIIDIDSPVHVVIPRDLETTAIKKMEVKAVISSIEWLPISMRSLKKMTIVCENTEDIVHSIMRASPKLRSIKFK